MKHLLLIIFIVSSLQALSSTDRTLSGRVEVNASCSKKVMAWLSLDKESYKERLLLMHTEVPQGGTFRFYVKPGSYQVRVTDESSCEYFTKVDVKTKDIELTVKMEKK